MEYQPNPKAIYWLDVETTGLDPNHDRILEISMSRAPFERPLDASLFANYVIGFRDWSDVHPRVIEMHAKSGLMLDCMKSELTIDGVQVKIIDSIKNMFDDDWQIMDMEKDVLRAAKSSNELPVLGGSSVDFDRNFLKSDMPDLAAMFGHRVYDISSLKLLCRSVGMPPQPKKEAHRSAEDIKESITHTRECFLWLEGNLTSKLLDERIRRPPPF